MFSRTTDYLCTICRIMKGKKSLNTFFFAHNKRARQAHEFHSSMNLLYELKGAFPTKVKVVDLKSSELCVTAGRWVLEFLGVFEPVVRQEGSVYDGRIFLEQIKGGGSCLRAFIVNSFKQAHYSEK